MYSLCVVLILGVSGFVITKTYHRVKQCTEDIRSKFESADAQISEFRVVQESIEQGITSVERRIIKEEKNRRMCRF